MRILRLVVGLVLYGVGCAVMVAAGIGVDPWTVLAAGVSVQTGIGIGWVTNAIGFLVLLLWIPLRQRPGFGTIANVLLVGTSMQLALPLLPRASGLLVGTAEFLLGMVLVAVATAVYLGARFGAGPRDGLMTGIHARLGLPIWRARAVVEVTVLLCGWALGGQVGWGTLLFAAGIGPLVHVALRVGARTRRRAARTGSHAPSPGAVR